MPGKRPLTMPPSCQGRDLLFLPAHSPAIHHPSISPRVCTELTGGSSQHHGPEDFLLRLQRVPGWQDLGLGPQDGHHPTGTGPSSRPHRRRERGARGTGLWGRSGSHELCSPGCFFLALQLKRGEK